MNSDLTNLTGECILPDYLVAGITRLGAGLAHHLELVAQRRGGGHRTVATPRLRRRRKGGEQNEKIERYYTCDTSCIMYIMYNNTSSPVTLHTVSTIIFTLMHWSMSDNTIHMHACIHV